MAKQAHDDDDDDGMAAAATAEEPSLGTNNHSTSNITKQKAWLMFLILHIYGTWD